MTVLDYFVLIVSVASLVTGATKGIIKGIVSVTFAVGAVVAAASFYQYAADLFKWLTSSAPTAQLMGFAAILILIIAAGSLLTFGLRSALKRVKLSWMDHALGAAFGLLRGWLICSAVYLGLTAIPLQPDAVRRAALAPALLEGTRVISYLTSQGMRQKFAAGYEAVREFWEQKR